MLIANTGQFAHLANCLRSLFETTDDGISFRVIVGFNFQGDSDNLPALDAAFPQVEKLRASVKLGYCRAYNQLLARSTGHINRYYFMRQHYGAAAFAIFRLIMTIGATMRLLTHVAVWLLLPKCRDEAAPKIAAYWQIACLGVAAHPERPTAELRRKNEQLYTFRPIAQT